MQDIINIYDDDPTDAASQTPPACDCKSASSAQVRVTLEILGIISHVSCSLNHDKALLGAKAASLPCRLGTGQ